MVRGGVSSSIWDSKTPLLKSWVWSSVKSSKRRLDSGVSKTCSEGLGGSAAVSSLARWSVCWIVPGG